MPRIRIAAVAAMLALALTVALPAEAAKYRYGNYSGGGGESGLTVSLEGGLVNVRNGDNVYATSETLQIFGGGVNSVVALTPASEDDASAKLGLTYQWASGNQLKLSFWNYSTETAAAGNGPLGGRLYYAIGPPIDLGGGSFAGVSGNPGYYDLTTETDASAIDIAFAREHEIADDFRMEWSAGLRYASFEESTSGFYDDDLFGGSGFGDNRYAAAKTTEGEMLGLRLAARGSYFFTSSFSASAGIGVSFADGEIDAFSRLTPTGLVNSGTQPTSLATVFDDGRSGRTFDVESRLTWHSSSDRFRLWLGWSQQEWSGIASDLLRNFPATARPLESRDSVVFSGYTLGGSYRF